MRIIIIVLFLLLFSFVSFPHDLWIEEAGNGFKLFYGHKHSAHSGDEIIEYNMDFVKSVKCQKAEKVEDISFKKEYPLYFEGNCNSIYVLFSSGYWTKTVYGTKNVSKEGVENVLKSWFSVESVKYIRNYNENSKKPISDSLEIVSLSDISKIKKGDKIRLKVFYGGKPKANVVVAYKDKPRGETDEEGNINITIKDSGFQVISASITEKGDGIKADEKIITTNLNFQVKE